WRSLVGPMCPSSPPTACRPPTTVPATRAWLTRPTSASPATTSRRCIPSCGAWSSRASDARRRIALFMHRFRVVCLAAIVALGLTPVIARADDAPQPNGGQLVDACRSSIGDTPELGNRTCRSVEAETNGFAAYCRKQPNVDPDVCARFSGRVVSQAKVNAYEKSWTHRALGLQRDLDDAAPLLDEMVIHTHNSFNSSSYPTTVTNQDPNQLYGLANQLRMDIRFLELDLHWVPSIYGTPA